MKTDKQKVEGALGLIWAYGCTDGEHHKKWLLNELVLVLTDDYDKWVKEYQSGKDGPETYVWDTGIAP